MPSFANAKGANGDLEMLAGKSEDGPTSDLAKLFNQALLKYLKTTKRQLPELTQIDDFHDALVGTTQIESAFDKSRHPDTKLNAVITTVGPCMEWVSSGFQFVADHASGSFASPAKAIAGAAVHLIKAAQNVTEDLDAVVACFARIKDTISNISILGDYVPEHEHFRHRLMLVFTSMLEFCGFAETLFSKHSKAYMYFKTLVSGRNQKVFDKCTAVTQAIESFRETIPYSALALQGEIKSKVEDVPQKTFEIFMTAIKRKEFDPKDALEGGKAETIIRAHFSTSTQGRLVRQSEPPRPEDVTGSFDAVFDLTTYKKWYDGKDTSFLWVSGPSGCGKSFFASSMKHRLEAGKQEERSLIVAQFCFAPGETLELRYAIHDIILQIARKDKKFADQIAKEIERKRSPSLNSLEPVDLWRQVIQDRFPRTSEPTTRTLFVLLDGVDQMEEQSRAALLEIFSGLSPDRSAIYVMYTSDQSVEDKLDGEKARKDITARYPRVMLQNHTNADINNFADSKYEKSSILKRIPKPTWEKHKQKILAKAQGIFAYVDVVLARMEKLGVDPAGLNKFIDDLEAGTEGLYAQMSEMLIKSRNENERRSLTTFYNWIVFGTREFSLKELGHLLELDKEYAGIDFNIEKEIREDRSSSVLYLERRPGTGQTVQNDTDTSDERALELAETFVVFRQPLFKDFLRSTVRPNSLISDTNATRIDILTLLCDIICGSLGISPASRAGLQNYAVSSVLSHLIAIEIETANKTQTVNVVEALSKLFTNSNEASQKIEEATLWLASWDPEFDLYVKFDQLQKNGRTVQQTIISWANKIRYHGAEDLAQDTKEWVQNTVLKEGSQALVPLIKGHIDSWLTKVTEESALPPFQLASQAIRASKLIAESDAQYLSGSAEYKFCEQSIEAVSRALKVAELSLDQNARARISIALLANSTGSEEKSADYAQTLYLQNIQEAVSGAIRFYSLLGLAECYMSKAERSENQEKDDEEHGRQTGKNLDDQKQMYSEAASYAELALRQHDLEKNPLGSDLEPSRLRQAYLIRATALRKVGDEDRAVLSLDTAFEKLSPSPKLENLADEMLSILSRKNDHLGIIRRMQLWPSEVRNQWLSSWDASNFRRAVVQTHRMDFLIRCYNEAIDYLSANQLYGHVWLKYELAQVYRKDFRLAHVSRPILTELGQTVEEILLTQPAIRDYFSGFWKVIQRDLLDLLFEDFYATDDQKRRKDILEDVHKLCRDVAASTNQSSSVQDAGYDFTLAKMCSTLGLVLDTRKYITRAFDICITDLTDTMAGNDQEAFTILGRVLHFANLEADARIAFSMRLSLVDETYEDRPQPIQPASTSITQTVTPSNNIRELTNGIETSSTFQIPSENRDTSLAGEDREHLRGEGSKSEEKTLMPNGITEKGGSGSDKLSRPGTAIPQSTNGKSVDTDASSAHSLEQKDAEEYDMDGSVGCNGCEDPPYFESWFGTRTGQEGQTFTPPIYVCLACANVDLCQGCYDIQSAYQKGTGMGFWNVVCPGSSQHRYVKQPIEGWLGVKNGVIHMKAEDGGGTQHRTKSFKEWLADVRNRFAVVNWGRVVAAHNSPDET